MAKALLGAYLEQCLEESQDVDIRLKAFDVEFPLHRIILKRSEYAFIKFSR